MDTAPAIGMASHADRTALLKCDEFERLVADPKSRRDHYRTMLLEFYGFATGPYRENWADSFHLPPFRDGEPLEVALREQEHALARSAGFRAGMRVLDLGCGVGGPALTIAQFSKAQVTGLNIVPRQVAIARSRAAAAGLARRAEFVLGDMMDIPFDDGDFDGAFSFEAICHAPDKQRVYREVARVLKPGAVFAGCDWVCADGLGPADYQKWIEPICASSALPWMLSIGGVAEGLERAGFVVEECCDLAKFGDMTRNWEMFQHAAGTIDRSGSPEKEQLWRHTSATARAGRSGHFLIGYWFARKAK